MNFLLIGRESRFSPGRVEDDDSILSEVGSVLRRCGEDIDRVRGDDFLLAPVPAKTACVLCMCQEPEALTRLDELAVKGVRVINRPEAIRRCLRSTMIATLVSADLPFPSTAEVPTDSVPSLTAFSATDGLWIKRADFHAVDAGDVVRVDDPPSLLAALTDFAQRGLPRVLLQEHIEGQLFKCYVVKHRFLSCHPPLPADRQEEAEKLIAGVATAFDLDVFGVDLLLAGAERLLVLDVNDWPSFRACAAAAGEAIAAYAREAIKH